MDEQRINRMIDARVKTAIQEAKTEWRESLMLEMRIDRYDSALVVMLSDADGDICSASVYDRRFAD